VQVGSDGDAVVDDGGEAARVAEDAAGDRDPEHGLGVVPGDLGLPQHARQADGALVDHERRTLPGSQRAVNDPVYLEVSHEASKYTWSFT